MLFFFIGYWRFSFINIEIDIRVIEIVRIYWEYVISDGIWG